jgi:hypothetical protein
VDKICSCEPQDRYIKGMDFVYGHAEGFCLHCMKRAVPDGEWAECPCCHKRWKYETHGDTFSLEFNHDKTARMEQG